MLQKFFSALRQIPVKDPVDRRNAIFVQWLLIFEGLRKPLDKLYLLTFDWSFLRSFYYDKARCGPQAAIAIDLGTDIAITLACWLGLFLIRKGTFRLAVKQYLGVMLASAALGYVAFGYQATGGNIAMIEVLALSGLMLGRRALWLVYFTEISIFAASMAADLLFHTNLTAAAIKEGFAALPIAALGYLLIALIIDRSIYALRQSLDEANAQREQLQREIIEREKTQEQLLHAQKMDAIGKLASGLAHDINNVLGIILGFTMERDRVEQDGEISGADAMALADALDGVELAARRGVAVCRKLLNFSRLDITNIETFDACEALRALKPLLQQLLDPSMRLTISTPSVPLLIDFDRSQFELALLNLATNARDAMPNGGLLSLVLSKSTAFHVVLEVRDSGMGMSPLVMQHVFEPFYTTKPVGQGTGLGLSTVHSLVKKVGGSITVESWPGQGTSFQVVLPMSATPT
ncbi:ATP-binding protein [Dyella sp. C11]|uniref:sensor histidine kinase n=1 Tax=Dyella sp. C11 TaxID=2126991 RepID=UPI000D653491|nr:ATP-binding protein [Dyella sp. C11]